MKKILSLTLTLVLLLGLCCGIASAAGVNVYVTISDKDGKLVLVQEKISVTDIDNDGKITINDALYCAHESKYSGGAAAGYASATSDWGLSLTKLWGTENGGSYGYYVNNTAAMSLTDEVKDGAYLTAFVYTDLTAWSDTYSYFDKNTAAIKAGDTVGITLNSLGFDASYNTVVSPVEGATILINGKAADVKTDANGKASFKIDAAGTYTISAKSDSMTLVPPVLVVTATAASDGAPKTADTMTVTLLGAIAVLSFGAVVITRRRSAEA